MKEYPNQQHIYSDLKTKILCCHNALNIVVCKQNVYHFSTQIKINPKYCCKYFPFKIPQICIGLG